MGLFDFFSKFTGPKQPSIPVKSSSSLPDVASGNYYAAYHYDSVKFYPPYSIISKVKHELRPLGSDVILVTEPSNEHDDRAIALYISGNKIGYMLRGILQDMVHDYFDQNLPVKASLQYLKRVDGEYQGRISLTFYHFGTNSKRLGYSDIDIKSIKPTNPQIMPNTPLTGKKVVFCGYFDLPLEEMMQKAVDAGAILRAAVSKTVDYVVVGKNNDTFLDENGMSSKEATATRLNKEGVANIKLISGNTFLELIQINL